MKFDNKTKYEFKDISSEEWRVYNFQGFIIRIDNPLKLHVSNSGGHRIFDSSGISHYVPSGWNHLYWKAKEGSPNFVA